jgi:hypothetical protein
MDADHQEGWCFRRLESRQMTAPGHEHVCSTVNVAGKADSIWSLRTPKRSSERGLVTDRAIEAWYHLSIA